MRLPLLIAILVPGIAFAQSFVEQQTRQQAEDFQRQQEQMRLQQLEQQQRILQNQQIQPSNPYNDPKVLMIAPDGEAGRMDLIRRLNSAINAQADFLKKMASTINEQNSEISSLTVAVKELQKESTQLKAELAKKADK